MTNALPKSMTCISMTCLRLWWDPMITATYKHQREVSFILDLESLQVTYMSHVLVIHNPINGAIMLRSVDGCDESTYQDRGDACSSDRSFSFDVTISICFNSRNAVLEDFRWVLDTLIIEVRQGHKLVMHSWVRRSTDASQKIFMPLEDFNHPLKVWVVTSIVKHFN